VYGGSRGFAKPSAAFDTGAPAAIDETSSNPYLYMFCNWT
jgi:hypothetical protein